MSKPSLSNLARACPPAGVWYIKLKMVSQDLLDLLVCPYCKSQLKLVKGVWLVCQNQECHRKYPIRDEIPVMLIEEGDKYREVPESELPVPP